MMEENKNNISTENTGDVSAQSTPEAEMSENSVNADIPSEEQINEPQIASDFTQSSQTYYTYQTTSSADFSGYSNADEIVKKKSMTAFVLGIISAVSSFFACCCLPVAPVFGIISILMSLKAKKLSESKKFDTKSLVGFICSIAGIAMYLFITFVIAFFALIVIANPDTFDVSWGGEMILKLL